MLKKRLLTSLTVFIALSVHAQKIPVNYDEAKVPAYTLPDPLQLDSNKRVTSADEWLQRQRPDMLTLFKQNVYGQFPGKPADMHFRVRSIDSLALNGKAIRKEITIFFTRAADAPSMELLLYLPKGAKQPVGVFAGLNFCGNQCVSREPGIALSTRWMQDNQKKDVVNNHATEATRGTSASRWPLEEIIRRGYGLATAYYGDLEPDHADGWKTGVRTTMKDNLQLAPADWAAIGAWAWGLSRIMDYLETEPSINAKHTAVIGHSRLGKAAAWAGANDTRFGMVILNNSGEGGAALARRWYGETIEVINTQFPHWFVQKFKDYNGKAERLPVDQHILLSLMAPRPLYIASAQDDQWADPMGEFLSAKNAEPVYALFGKKGLGVEAMPPVNHPAGETIRYHIRTGVHDITLYDWQQYLDFADKQFK